MNSFSAPTVSVIACSRDDRRFAAVSATYRRALADWPFEIVRVVGARSLAEGYNRGFRQSRGEVVIFSHDDIEVLTPNLAARLGAHLKHFDVVGVAGTNRLVHPKWVAAGHPHIFGQVAYPSREGSGYTVAIFGAPARAVGQIQALDGVLLAVKRHVLDRVTFDEASFDGFHLYDLDFTYRAYLEGFKLAVANDLNVVHQSGGDYGDAWLRYAKRFVRKHGLELSDSHNRRPRWHRWAVVEVSDRQQMLEVMSPGYWDAPDDDGPAREADQGNIAATRMESVF